MPEIIFYWNEKKREKDVAWNVINAFKKKFIRSTTIFDFNRFEYQMASYV